MNKSLLYILCIFGFFLGAHSQCRIDTVYVYDMQKRTVKYVRKYSYRTIKKYDSNNNLIEEVTHWPWYVNYILDRWQETSRNYYTYDANNLLLTSDVFTSNYISPKQYYREKHTYTYNASKQKIGDFIQWYDSTSWVDINRTDWIYNANSTEKKYTVYKTKNSGSDFSNKSVTTYNSDGAVSIIENFFLSIAPATYTKTTKFEYQYNSAKLLISLVQSYFNTTTNMYDLIYKNDYTYNAKNKVTENISFYYDDVAKKWVEDTKETTTYDANDKRIEFTTTRHNSSTNKWDNYKRDSFSYYGNGYLKYWQNWELVSTVYSPRYQNFYTYNFDNGLTYINRERNFLYSLDKSWRKSDLFLYTYYVSSNYMEYLQYYSWDANLEQFTSIGGYTNVCSVKPTLGINKNENAGFRIFPNPIKSNSMSIRSNQTATCSVLSFTGKIIFSFKILNGFNTISLPQNISAGIYFVQMGNSIQKLVIE